MNVKDKDQNLKGKGQQLIIIMLLICIQPEPVINDNIFLAVIISVNKMVWIEVLGKKDLE